MAASTLEPLADREHGTIYLHDGSPASRATARVFTRRKGELVELPVWADVEKSRRLAQPLTAGRDGRLPGLVSKRHRVEVEATWRGRTITTQAAKKAQERAQAALDAEARADARARAAARMLEARAAVAERAKAAIKRQRLNQQRALAAAVRDTKLTMEFADPDTGLLVQIVVPDYQPSYDADHNAAVIPIPPGFGINPDDIAYYNTGGPSPGEGAVLGVSQATDYVLTRLP